MPKSNMLSKRGNETAGQILRDMVNAMKLIDQVKAKLPNIKFLTFESDKKIMKKIKDNLDYSDRELGNMYSRINDSFRVFH